MRGCEGVRGGNDGGGCRAASSEKQFVLLTISADAVRSLLSSVLRKLRQGTGKGVTARESGDHWEMKYPGAMFCLPVRQARSREQERRGGREGGRRFKGSCSRRNSHSCLQP